MSRFINQINVSITTNRTCNLRCNHCYIQPELFKDKTQITIKDYKLIFDRVQDLYDMDANLEEVEWEFIGGETTMMPFEFWEEMLPWTLDRITEFNKQLRVPGSMNFLSNLMFSDDRYVDLLNKYADHPVFNLYTSWEPDTNRFGTNNKLLPRFKKTMERLTAKHLTMDVIMTKGVMEYGAKRIIDEFIPLGVTDLSCKMLSPYGSGKAFFEPNMATFGEMSRFLIDLNKHKPDYVTFTPDEEMRGSLHVGTSFQCNGNFYYDLTVEPNGSTSFNASQTGDEAALGSDPIHLSDPLWAQKVCFYNTEEADNKLSIKHEECSTCDYLQFCNAGWYHYKLLPEGDINRYNGEDCAGLKNYWDTVKAEMGTTVDLQRRNHLLAVRESMKSLPKPVKELNESELKLKAMLTLSADERVTLYIDKETHFGKPLDERLWFYDALRWDVVISDELVPEIENIVDHCVRGEYHVSTLSVEQVMRFMALNPESVVSQKVNAIATVVNGFNAGLTGEATNILSTVDDLIVRWVWVNIGLFSEVATISEQDNAYLEKLKGYTNG